MCTTLTHQLAEGLACAGAVTLVHDDDVLRAEWLSCDVAAVEIFANVEAPAVVGREHVAQIPADQAGLQAVISVTKCFCSVTTALQSCLAPVQRHMVHTAAPSSEMAHR